MTKIFIATPCYGGLVSAPYTQSLTQLLPLLAQHQIEHQLVIQAGSCIVQQRCQLAADFLHSDCTHLLFIDADHGFDPALVLELLDADRDLIGAPYRTKVPGPPRYDFEPLFVGSPGAASLVRDGELLRVLALGTGFMLIKRRVLEVLAEKNPKLMTGNGLGVFLPFIHGGKIIGEDYAFCLRWGAAGGQVWCVLRGGISHHGSLLSFDSNVDEIEARLAEMLGTFAVPEAAQ
ncbi:MAG TPA: hypothetical protein VGI10_12520 [Polyangiaceae bacterium]|jgi:hypothetical protein